MNSSVRMHLANGTRTATVAERQETGKTARRQRSRTSLATFTPAADRADPVQLLAGQETYRQQALLPLRHSRMAASAFAFYRGSATVMASDLGAMPNSGLITQLCGDAHLSNFGLFAAPDRSVVFDINDFDETNPGPFEWDVMRMTTSFVLAGRDVALPTAVCEEAARSAAREYRIQMAQYAGMRDLEVWYDRVSIDVIQQWAKQDGRPDAGKQVTQMAARARRRDQWSAISKMTEVVEGQRRFLNDPPVLIRIAMDELMTLGVTAMLEEYQKTLAPDRRELLQRYHIIDMAHKVVGVGSVGLLAFVILLQGRDENDLMVLQAKQAVASVLEPFTATSRFEHSGQRVVVGQQFLQAASDVFLGWVRGNAGRDYYVRQLRDMKYSIDPTQFNEQLIIGYARVCGRTLARAHARAGDSVAIATYCGTSTKFETAIQAFSIAYAAQAEKDFEKYKAAIASGRVNVNAGAEHQNYAFAKGSDGAMELMPVSAPEPAPEPAAPASS